MPSLFSPSRILSSQFKPTSNAKPITKTTCIVQNILNLCSQGRVKEAVNSLPLLARAGLRLDSKTLAYILHSCANSSSLKQGKWVHIHLKLTGLKQPNTFLANHLIYMYNECGDHVEARTVFDKMSTRNIYSWNNMLSGYVKLGMVMPARKLFDKMPERDVVSWNTMIVGYSRDGCFDEALRFYRELRGLGIGYNEYSFAGVVNVCVKLKDSRLVKQVHCQVFVVGFLGNVVLSSSILDAYGKCGELGDARRLFDEMGKRDILAWTTLVSGYAKWGDMKSARELFNAMTERNAVSWTALIAGYAENGMGYEALELFAKMMKLRIKPDQFSFSSCLCACASMASLKHGKQLHAYLITTGFRPNTVVVSSLIDMYSKCGSLEAAKRVFDIMGNKKEVVLWNTVISASAQHGSGEEAMNLFAEMVKLEVKPDRITFVVLLTACSHSGLVQEGLRYFESMTCDHNIIPDQEHYACLIDLLGRAGRFDEVINHLKCMPGRPDERVWNAILGACKIHENVELGRVAAKHLIELDPHSPAIYMLLSGIYAALGKWKSVEKVKQLMNERRIRKDQGLSWLEIKDKLHHFTIPSKSHPSHEASDSNFARLAEWVEDYHSSYHIKRQKLSELFSIPR